MPGDRQELRYRKGLTAALRAADAEWSRAAKTFHRKGAKEKNEAKDAKKRLIQISLRPSLFPLRLCGENFFHFQTTTVRRRIGDNARWSAPALRDGQP